MFIVITQNKIYKGKSLKDINRSIHGQMDLDEFHPLGGDYIVNLSLDDLDFVQDKKRLSNIMFGNFFKKDTLTRNLIIVNFIFTFICLIRLMG